MKHLILILLFVNSCWADTPPDFHCTCEDPPVDTYYIGYTEEEIDLVIETAKVDSINMICEEI